MWEIEYIDFKMIKIGLKSIMNKIKMRLFFINKSSYADS